MAIDRKYLTQEYSFLCQERMQPAAEWQRIAQYMVPNLQSIVRGGFEGYKKTDKIYDITGVDALDKLTTLIIGTATSAAVRWFSFEFSDPDINLLPEVQYWLDDCADRVFKDINDSNYKTAGPETIREIVAFGTGGMFQQEMESEYNPTHDFRGLHFASVPIGTYVIQEDGIGRVRQQTREFRMSALSMFNRWPNGEYSKETRKLITEKPYERVTIVHDTRQEGRLFKSCWYFAGRAAMVGFNQGRSLGELEYLHEGNFNEFPFVFPRWDKATGETWGFGRGHLAMPEVATLNRARQLKLRQWTLAINPPLLEMADGITGKPKIIPGARNRITMKDALMPFQTGVNFDHTAIPENDSKLQIRQIFYTEQILQFSPQAKTPPSATEVVQRMEFLHQLLGPSIGRIQDEFLEPMVQRARNIRERADGFLPKPEILKVAPGKIRVVFEGPLARSQRSDELRAIGDTMAVVSNLATVKPEVWDNYDVDLMSRDASRITGVSKRYLKSEDQVADERAQREQANAQAQELAAMQQGAEVAKNMGSAQASFAKAQAPQ